MGYGDTYDNLIRKIIQRLKLSVSDLRGVTYSFVTPFQPVKNNAGQVDYHRVNLGLKQVEQLNPPEAFIIPRDDNIERAATHTQYHSMGFEIIALTENSNTQSGLIEAIAFGWRIYDALLADRTILGGCQDLHISRFSPQVIDQDANKFLHQVNIFMTCKYLTTAGS